MEEFRREDFGDLLQVCAEERIEVRVGRAEGLLEASAEAPLRIALELRKRQKLLVGEEPLRVAEGGDTGNYFKLKTLCV